MGLLILIEIYKILLSLNWWGLVVEMKVLYMVVFGNKYL